jgi:glycosyltransferase involved in cell wall biosynthesis
MPETKNAARQRILYLDHTATLGGGEIALLRLLSQLDRRRFEPFVVLGGPGDLSAHIEALQIPTRIIPLKRSVAETRKDDLGARSLFLWREIAHLLAYSVRISEFIRAHEIDLVHTNSLKADIIGGLAARKAGVPCLWHVRDRISPDYLPRVIVALFRGLARFLPNGVVANSYATLRTLRSMPADEHDACGRYRVIYDGVIAPESVEPTDANRPQVALVGRISPWKGQNIFVEAAALTLQAFPSARFQIIGTPLFGEHEFEQTLRRRVCDLGLTDKIEFTGFLKDVPAHLKHIDIVVHASILGEPFGQVVIEGMAAGNATAMAAAILVLLQDPERARKMGMAGRQRAISLFPIARTARAFEELYHAYAC